MFLAFCAEQRAFRRGKHQLPASKHALSFAMAGSCSLSGPGSPTRWTIWMECPNFQVRLGAKAFENSLAMPGLAHVQDKNRSKPLPG